VVRPDGGVGCPVRPLSARPVMLAGDAFSAMENGNARCLFKRFA
jgi:hypothetical protein